MFNFNWTNFNANLVIFILILWEMFWKGMGLWKSARKGETLWFLGIFVVNFFGVVPIFYLWKTKQLESTVNDTLKFLHLKKQ